MASIEEQVLRLWEREEPMQPPSWIADVLGISESTVIRIITKSWLRKRVSEEDERD